MHPKRRHGGRSGVLARDSWKQPAHKEGHGVPDARLSEVGVAFVRLEPGHEVTEAQVIEHCRGKIASFKIPRHVIFVDDLPMTSSGKIQKVKLREDARRRLKVIE
ncbi:MAG: hypothetical protein ACE5JD_04195 [Candidatus Methylomirabilia bacterium]